MLIRGKGFSRRMQAPAGGEGDAGSGGAGDETGAETGAETGDETGAETGEEGDAGGDGDKDKDDAKTQAELQKVKDEKAKLLKESMSRKEKIRDLEQQLKQFDGIDPDAVRKIIKEREDAEMAEAERKGEFDRVKAQMVEKHTKALAEKDSENAKLRADLEQRDSIIAELTVGHAFDASKYIADELTLTPAKARVIYGNHFDVVDGKVVAYDKPRGEAERTIIVDSSGKPVGFEDALKSIIDLDPERDALIRSKVKSGSNSSTSRGVKKPSEGRETEKTGTSRIAAGLKSSKSLLIEPSLKR